MGVHPTWRDCVRTFGPEKIENGIVLYLLNSTLSLSSSPDIQKRQKEQAITRMTTTNMEGLVRESPDTKDSEDQFCCD